jgi:hypothetical protein
MTSRCRRASAAGGERRPVDARHGAQRELGHRHQRAGIAARQAASASPSFTALIAMPIEVVLARRIAWLGFSLGGDDVGAWTMVTDRPRRDALGELGLRSSFVAEDLGS